jgi:L-cysteine desulfidase
MEKREPDTSGDYGYDLAHEAVTRARAPENRAPGGTRPASHASGTGDQGQDYEYDEAHDF